MILDWGRFFNFRSAVTQVWALLTVLALLATIDVGSSAPDIWFRFGFIFLVATIFIVILRNGLNIERTNPANFFISTIIIYLLIHPTEPLYFYIITLGILAAEKAVRGKRFPLLNPAAAALAGAYLISLFMKSVSLLPQTLLISWWGADFRQAFLSDIPILNILVATFFVVCLIRYAFYFGKGPLIASFALTVVGIVYTSNLTVTNSSIGTIAFIQAAIFNSFAFLALVMIPEPNTSSAFTRQQVLVGIAGGLLFYLSTFVFLPEFNSFLLTVLGMNVITIVMKKYGILNT